MRKQASKSKLKNISIFYQKYSPILKLKKWRRNKLIEKKSNSKKNVVSRFKNRFRYSVSIAIIAMLAILAIYYHLNTYFKIKPIPFENQKTQSSFTFPYYNVVFLWFDEENEKYFADGVVVVSINASDETVKILGINSDFIINYQPLKQSFTSKNSYIIKSILKIA
ncbi:MAG: hypothetical protein KatS3mg085_376 [Candidatus Dojkabacteria bacterium]|nr:MAG: hypothetical protein KatS3mg085_376 [Candidatus Dojkabacteria bacterium]